MDYAIIQLFIFKTRGRLTLACSDFWEICVKNTKNRSKYLSEEILVVFIGISVKKYYSNKKFGALIENINYGVLDPRGQKLI